MALPLLATAISAGVQLAGTALAPTPSAPYLSGSDVMKQWSLEQKLRYQAEAAAGRLRALEAAQGAGAFDVVGPLAPPGAVASAPMTLEKKLFTPLNILLVGGIGTLIFLVAR